MALFSQDFVANPEHPSEESRIDSALDEQFNEVDTFSNAQMSYDPERADRIREERKRQEEQRRLQMEAQEAERMQENMRQNKVYTGSDWRQRAERKHLGIDDSPMEFITSQTRRFQEAHPEWTPEQCQDAVTDMATKVYGELDDAIASVPDYAPQIERDMLIEMYTNKYAKEAGATKEGYRIYRLAIGDTPEEAEQKSANLAQGYVNNKTYKAMTNEIMRRMPRMPKEEQRVVKMHMGIDTDPLQMIMDMRKMDYAMEKGYRVSADTDPETGRLKFQLKDVSGNDVPLESARTFDKQVADKAITDVDEVVDKIMFDKTMSSLGNFDNNQVRTALNAELPNVIKQFADKAKMRPDEYVQMLAVASGVDSIEDLNTYLQQKYTERVNKFRTIVQAGSKKEYSQFDAKIVDYMAKSLDAELGVTNRDKEGDVVGFNFTNAAAIIKSRIGDKPLTEENATIALADSWLENHPQFFEGFNIPKDSPHIRELLSQAISTSGVANGSIGNLIEQNEQKRIKDELAATNLKNKMSFYDWKKTRDEKINDIQVTIPESFDKEDFIDPNTGKLDTGFLIKMGASSENGVWVLPPSTPINMSQYQGVKIDASNPPSFDAIMKRRDFNTAISLGLVGALSESQKVKLKQEVKTYITKENGSVPGWSGLWNSIKTAPANGLINDETPKVDVSNIVFGLIPGAITETDPKLRQAQIDVINSDRNKLRIVVERYGNLAYGNSIQLSGGELMSVIQSVPELSNAWQLVNANPNAPNEPLKEYIYTIASRLASLQAQQDAIKGTTSGKKGINTSYK